jgi:predicted MPP superfamily phosphohydrolase
MFHLPSLHPPSWTPDLVILLICLQVVRTLIRRYAANRWRVAVLWIAGIILVVGMSMTEHRVAALLPNPWSQYLRGGAIALGTCLLGTYALWWLWERIPFSPERREVLSTLKVVSMAAPAAFLGAAYISRDDLRLREIEIPIVGLPKDLHGLRIVQISDIHLSPLVSEKLLARAIDMANGTRAHLALVTGDLITREGDPLDTCIRHLARLRADAGILGCMGNHEIYAQSEEYTEEACRRIGIQFLRGTAKRLRFGQADLNFAGVDYQSKLKGPYLVGTEKLVVPGMPNILLSHNPDVFPVAAAKGYDLTLSGHTHGGQVNVEILHRNLNIARFFTPYVDGLYRQASSAIFVTRGVGTVGLPARLGALPEVALIKLCAISS